MKKKHTLIIALLCIVGFIINISAYSPGFMSPDSFEQYKQSLTHQYNDWHPPVMAWLWSLLNNIYQGPQPMLWLQLSMLWVSCFFFCVASVNKAWQFVVLTLYGLSPFILNFAGYIIKDVQMAFCWLAACSILFYFIITCKEMNWRYVIMSLLLLIYGALLRPNALPGYIPLLVLWCFVALPLTGNKTKAIIVTLTVIGTITIQKTLPRLLHAEKQYAENKLYLHDLAGIYKTTGNNIFPAVLFQNNLLDTAYIRTKYHPATFDDIWWNADGKTLLPDTNEVVTSAIKDAWLRAIFNNPKTYIKNRYEGYLYYLHIKKRSDFYCNYYMYMYPDPNEYSLTPKYDNTFYKLYHSMFVAQKDMFYMKAWFWMFMNILLLPFIWVIRDKRQKVFFSCLVLSGFLYKLPDFFIYQSDVDYRYFYWNTIVCCIGILIVCFRNVLKPNYKKAAN